APSTKPSTEPSSTPPSTVRAAAEKTIEAKPSRKPGAKRTQTAGTASGRRGPLITGPKIPEAMRAQLQKQLEARIDRNLGHVRQPRADAIGLLTTFVAETPREAREMPEALLRLGELRWELEREQSVERFRAWEAKPVDQRGPAPGPNFQPSRDLFARVLKEYPWFGQYDLALYVDGFLAYEQGRQDDALARFDRILKEHPNSRFVPDAHMARE